MAVSGCPGPTILMHASIYADELVEMLKSMETDILKVLRSAKAEIERIKEAAKLLAGAERP